MTTKLNETIVLVAGDVYADWLLIDKEQSFEEEKNATPGPHATTRAWKNDKRVFIPAVHGGAWIVERFLRMMLPPELAEKIYGYRRLTHEQLRSGDSNHFIHQFTNLKLYPLSESGKGQAKTYRAEPGTYRFSGPYDDELQLHPILLPIQTPGMNWNSHVCGTGTKLEYESKFSTDVQESFRSHTQTFQNNIQSYPPNSRRIVLIYERGNGFCEYQNRFENGNEIFEDKVPAWKYLFFNDHQMTLMGEIGHVLISIKNLPRLHPGASDSSTDPNTGHAVLDFLIENSLLERTTVVLDADDLRHQGAHITRGSSWERTAQDTLKLFLNDSFLKRLSKAHKIVIRFGISAAVVRLQANGLDRTSIVFDPSSSETGYSDTSRLGKMYPMDAVMLAVLASGVFQKQNSLGITQPTIDADDCIESVSRALGCCRTYFDRGCNRQSLDRKMIEGWDSDHQSGIYDATKVVRDKRITVLGRYEEEPWQTKRASIKFDVYFNDEYDVGSLFTDPEMAQVVVRRICEETFNSGLKQILVDCCDNANIDASRFFKICIKKLEGRSSRIFTTIDVNLNGISRTELSELAKQLDSQFDKTTEVFKKHVRVNKFDIKKLSAVQAWFEDRIKLLAIREHERITQAYHHRLYSPFTLLDIQKDLFGNYELSSTAGAEWVMLPTGEDKLIELSQNLVLRGFSRMKERNRFPYAKFGKMTIVDRFEIETFRSLNSLLRNYLKRKLSDRPLCAAVFGPPGSGKSFGVKQLAYSCGIDPDDILEYNLSQFESRADLERALINVRNACSPSRTPLVFFDEFDCSHGDERLGWLKMFLSVMQDGTFSFNGDSMRLGKSILVFAGGTKNSFAEFTLTQGAPESSRGALHEEFKNLKGPDFVSRLRGYIDIAGVNPVDVLQKENSFHFLRRATIIRSILEREYPELIDASGLARIDLGVLNALLRVSSYTHGARSLVAIFDMSNLADSHEFERSRLPSEHQLAMHLEKSEKHDGVKEFFMLLNGAKAP